MSYWIDYVHVDDKVGLFTQATATLDIKCRHYAAGLARLGLRGPAQLVLVDDYVREVLAGGPLTDPTSGEGIRVYRVCRRLLELRERSADWLACVDFWLGQLQEILEIGCDGFWFNGTDQYITIPNWKPLGFPASIEQVVVPGIVGDEFRATISGASFGTTLRALAAGSPASLQGYKQVDEGSTSSSVTDVLSEGLQYNVLWEFLTDTHDVSANGQTNISGGRPSWNNFSPISRIGNYGSANFWSGFIRGVKLNDDSPLQSAAYQKGDDSRYLVLANDVRLFDNPCTVELAWRRYDRGVGDGNQRLIGARDGSTRIQVQNNADSSTPDRVQMIFDGAGRNGTDAVQWIGQGQHSKLAVVRSTSAANLTTFLVDGAEVATDTRSSGDVRIGHIGGAGGTNTRADETLIGDVYVKDDETNEEWFWPLNEGFADINIQEDMSDDFWTPAGGGAINRGLRTFETTGGGSGLNSKTGVAESLVAGKQYEVTVEGMSGDFEIRYRDAASGTGTTVLAADGTATFKFDDAAAAPNLYLRANTATVASWDSLVVSEARTDARCYTDKTATVRKTRTDALFGQNVQDGNSDRLVELQNAATIPANDDFRLSYAWIRQETSGTDESDMLGTVSADHYVKMHDTDGNNVQIRCSGANKNYSGTPLDAIAVGEMVQVEHSRISGLHDLGLNGVFVGASAGTQNAFSIERLCGRLGGGRSIKAGGPMGNILLENLTTGESWYWPLDEGAGTAALCYEGVGGARKPTYDGTWVDDADDWTYISEYAYDGEWTDSNEWETVPDNSRHYPIDETEGTVVADVIGGQDGTIINESSTGGGWCYLWQELSTPDSVYAAEGEYTFTYNSTAHPGPFEVGEEGRTVKALIPNGDGPFPVIFYGRAYEVGKSFDWDTPGEEPELLRFLARKGYIVVYDPAFRDDWGGTAAQNKLWNHTWNTNAFDAAGTAWASKMDLTRVGYIGHSWNGGAAPFYIQNLLTNQGWGTNGAFCMCIAQYYTFYYDNAALASLATAHDIPWAFYVLDDDDETVNDPRMAKDIYDNLPVTNKALFRLSSDARGSKDITLDHRSPAENAEGDEHIQVSVYGRHAAALADYAFNGTAAGLTEVMNGGSATNLDTGMWGDPADEAVTPMEWSPTVFPADTQYDFKFSSILNTDRP